MPSKFHYTIKKKDNITYISLTGIIDEDNNLTELGDKIGGGTIIINLENIERINSCGVRDWVNWLSSIESKGANVILYNCSPAIVAQINLVNNFAGNAVIKSFYAPYYCENCDKEKVLLIETATIKSQNEAKAPISRCDECDGVMEFDDMEESYFAFVNNVKIGPLPKTLPADWEEFVQIESTHHTQDKRVKTRERTLRGKKSFASGGSLPGSLPSSLPSLPTSSLPTLSTRDSRSSTFSSLPSFPSSDEDSTSDSKSSNKSQTLIVVLVTLLFLLTVGVLVFVLWKLL